MSSFFELVEEWIEEASLELEGVLWLTKRVISNPLQQVVAIALLLLATVTAVLSLLLDSIGVSWLPSFLQNLSAGMVCALITFFLIELFFVQGREIAQIHEDLRSSSNNIARSAIDRARISRILVDGSLVRQAFENVNWEGGNLSGAVLTDGAVINSNLKGANLQGADIYGVDFTWTQFDENTILPDGTRWKSNDDPEKFR